MEKRGDEVTFTATPRLACEIDNYHFASASYCWKKLHEPVFLPALRLFHLVQRENDISQSVKQIPNSISLAVLQLKVEKTRKATVINSDRFIKSALQNSERQSRICDLATFGIMNAKTFKILSYKLTSNSFSASVIPLISNTVTSSFGHTVAVITQNPLSGHGRPVVTYMSLNDHLLYHHLIYLLENSIPQTQWNYSMLTK